MRPRISEIPVEVSDGSRLVATLTRDSAAPADAPVVVCFSAMGVRASYYRPFAAALCDQGVAVVNVDLRGIGTSSERASRGCDFGYREVVELDFPAVLAAVQRALPDRPIHALGHSLGGQLACLFAAANPGALAGIVLVASCSVYFRAWSVPRSLFVLCFAQTAHLVARIRGFFPGYLVRFGDREARRLVRDWAHQGRTGRYEVAGSKLDFEALLGRSTVPILAISFSDDSYCPPAAVEHLLAKMPAAQTTHLHLPPGDLGAAAVGHFGWVQRNDGLVPRIVAWLRRDGVSPARSTG